MDDLNRIMIIEAIINEEAKAFPKITDEQKERLLSEFFNSNDTYENIRNQVIDRLKQLEENIIIQEEAPKTVEEKIAEEYGVNPKDIKHLKFDDGTEAFQFYNSTIGRTVLIENTRKDLSMQAQLELGQQELEAAQGTDDMENAKEVLEYQRLHGREIPLVPMNELQNHEAEISGLDSESIARLTALAEKEEELDIKYVSIKHCVAVGGDNKVVEARLDKDSNQFVVDSPKEYSERDSNSKVTINQEDHIGYEAESEPIMDIEPTQDLEQNGQVLGKPLSLIKKRKEKRNNEAAFVNALILAFIVGCVSGLFSMILIRIITNAYNG